MSADACYGDTYLIVLNQFIVAQDIAQTINEHEPSANVIVAADADSALSSLEAFIQANGKGKLALAFLGLDQSALTGHALTRVIAEGGGSIVLIGDEAEDKGVADNLPGWWVLPRPFTTEAVLTLMSRALQPRPVLGA